MFRPTARLTGGDAAERTTLEQRAEELKVLMKGSASQEQHTNEADVVQAWQQEEARWNNLIARLQQIVER